MDLSLVPAMRRHIAAINSGATFVRPSSARLCDCIDLTLKNGHTTATMNSETRCLRNLVFGAHERGVRGHVGDDPVGAEATYGS